MGRDLSWYIIPSNIKHDHSKRLCMNYECEPEEFDVERDIYEKIKIDNKFSDRKNYREISSKDIDCAFHEIESFGKPSQTYDIEAYDETMTILHFLRKYCKPEYRIIMDDEI